MKFLSYAQNFEDVILNRAFKNQDSGFFLDVGAAHPVGHSVTKNFSARGWRGINIEPGTAAFQLVVADRPRDINLNVGISSKPGELTFFEAPDSLGLSTFNADWREKWQAKDGWNFVEKTVPVMTLTQVCETYVDEPIDFLKIDVEGHEPEVLAGADFARWRPKVVVVEGARELYQEKLLNSDYLHATFDGVNHYFVASEASHLIALLDEPVSLVIDDFELYETACERIGHHSAIQHLNEARRRCAELEAETERYRQIREESTTHSTGSASEHPSLIKELEQRIATLERDLARSEMIRTEVELSLDDTLRALDDTRRSLAEMSERHDVLRAKVAPLIEAKRLLRKVNGALGHPAHKFRMMSSGIRRGIHSTSRTRD